ALVAVSHWSSDLGFGIYDLGFVVWGRRPDGLAGEEANHRGTEDAEERPLGHLRAGNVAVESYHELRHERMDLPKAAFVFERKVLHGDVANFAAAADAQTKPPIPL